MQVTVAAIGRLKVGPERVLFERYVERAGKAGRKLGLSIATREFPESRAGSAATRMTEEGSTLLAAAPEHSIVIALDESGDALTSDAFAKRLAAWRDDGRADVVAIIGGADGLGANVKKRADLRLAFGAMTWPHQLVRLMLAEQIYRAVTILSGHPYHRA